MDEPSVFDYIKSKILFWKNIPIVLPSDINEADTNERISDHFESNMSGDQSFIESPIEQTVYQAGQGIPWRIIISLPVALFAQSMLEPPVQSVGLAIGLYVLAAILWIWALLSGDIHISDNWRFDNQFNRDEMSMDIRRTPFIIAMVFSLLAFIAFSNNRFTLINLLLWIAAIVFLIISLWVSKNSFSQRLQGTIHHFQQRGWAFTITHWTVLLILVTGISLFFRFFMLDQVPGEMFSDHAEKLLDVADVLAGKTSIFFERNTGREAIQMYLTAAISLICKTGLSFISLKIGTALAGFLALPFIYLLGKEIENRWVGLLAFLFAGIAYWPNVISRIGLRFPLYPLFVAPALFFLIRGLKTGNRNSFIFSGIALGLGLHGYSPFRLVPIVVVIVILIYLSHEKEKERQKQAVVALCILVFVALIVFLPLLRYMIEKPEMFNYRAMSRLSQTERMFEAPIWITLLSNLWKASIMFFWNNGDIWVHSVTNRPALDVITAVFFVFGVLLAIVRYIKNRSWVDLFLLISIPLLMMPSILSIAFPDENPSLNRTGGAIIPVFILAALGFEAFFRVLFHRVKNSKGNLFITGGALILIVVSMMQNYDLVFNQFNRQFMTGAWNTTSLGHTINAFANSVGNKDTAYVVPYPHWVDTRLVGINAGYPEKDYALSRELIPETINDKRLKMFLVKTDDIETIEELQSLYPEGSMTLKKSPYQGKDYYIYFVPAEK